MKNRWRWFLLVFAVLLVPISFVGARESYCEYDCKMEALQVCTTPCPPVTCHHAIVGETVCCECDFPPGWTKDSCVP